MIMVEALVQQLAAARTHGGPSVGPVPSELREKLVQTDHTELNQVKTHSINFKSVFTVRSLCLCVWFLHFPQLLFQLTL